jgi:regulator of sigma E protease
LDLTGLIRKKPGKAVSLQVDRRGETLTMSGNPRYDIQMGGIRWAFDKDNMASVHMMDSNVVKQDIREKDVLVSINKKPIKNGSDMQAVLEKDAAKPIDLVVKRGDEFKQFTLQPYMTWVKFHGARWAFPGGYVSPDDFDKSAAGNLKVGDLLLKIDGKAVKDAPKLLQALSGSKSNVDIVVDRDSKKISLTLPVGNVTSGYHVSVGVFGFALEPKLKREGFGKSIAQGFEHTYMAATLMVTTLTSRKVKDDVGGPVLIGKITQSAVNLGPYWVLATLGSLSISLAVINLVPIPLLDGGVLAVLAIEALRRKRLSLKEQNAVAMLGLMIIGLLVVTVLYSDIFKLVKGLVPQ